MRSIWKVWFSKRRKIYFRIARKFHTTPWKVYQLGHGGMSKNKKSGVGIQRKKEKCRRKNIIYLQSEL